jgi:hypothetical protein
MDFLNNLYTVICFVVLLMGCFSIYEHIKEWAYREDSKGKSLIKSGNREYFTVFVAVLLFFLFTSLIVRMGL